MAGHWKAGNAGKRHDEISYQVTFDRDESGLFLATGGYATQMVFCNESGSTISAQFSAQMNLKLMFGPSSLCLRYCSLHLIYIMDCR